MNKWVVRGKANAMNILAQLKSKKRSGEANANSKRSVQKCVNRRPEITPKNGDAKVPKKNNKRHQQAQKEKRSTNE